MAANIWLVLAVVAIFGCTNVSLVPEAPPESAFFGMGRIHSSTYTLMVLAMVAVSATFFILAWKTRKKS
jgi:heme/copper-type cytochrome/quinol oxidase subunit 2